MASRAAKNYIYSRTGHPKLVGGGLPTHTRGNVKRKAASTSTKKTGSFRGKSNLLGHGGRSAQLKARGVPGWKIGVMARNAHAAPGQANFHGKKKAAKKEKHMKMASHVNCKACKAMHKMHAKHSKRSK